MIFKKTVLNPFVLFIIFLATSCTQTTVKTAENYQAVSLPDGSEVLLNRNSSIHYDKNFTSRKISLTGEAFFQVASSTIPFVINTDYGKVQVLGTELNIKTSGEKLEVEVEKGVVEVQTKAGVKKVKRGRRAVYTKNGNSIELGKAEFKFRIWLSELKIEFKKIGKEIKVGGKKTGKEFKKIGKEINKGFN